MSKDHGRYYAVYNRAGVHIGLWSDGKSAAKVAAENPGNTIEEYIRADHVDAQLKAEREKAIPVAASLAAAISLLERGGKVAAPSNKMFEQMLKDYRRSLDDFRALIEKDATDV